MTRKKNKAAAAGSWVSKIEALERKLQQVSLSKTPAQPSKNRRRRNRRKAQRGSIAPMISVSTPTVTGAVPRRTRYSPGEGEMIFSRRELVGNYKIASGKSLTGGGIVVVPSSFKFLSKIGPCFERARWLYLRFYYVPACSVTTSGMIAMGLDWDSHGQNSGELETIMAYTPSVASPARQECQLVVPPARLMSREWYTPADGDAADKGPGIMRWAISSSTVSSDTTMGCIFVEYEVHLAGTTA